MLRLIFVVVLAAAAAAAAWNVEEQNSGPQVWSVSSAPHHRALRSLESEGLIDIWSGSGSYSKVLVEKDAEVRVRRGLEDEGLEYEVEVEDVLGLLKEDHERRRRRRRSVSQPMDWNTYHDFYDIEAFIGVLNQTSGGFLREEVAATTYEGRPVRVVRITDPSVTGNKKKIWIEGGIHAREWISPAVSTFLMHQLVTNPTWQPLLKVTEWYIAPTANPDGYQYTFNRENPLARWWRKNRRPNGMRGTCMGVDLNRNWDLKWGIGASGNPCSEVYKGPQPFSEPETQGLQNMMRQIGDIDLFITFHSFGQTVLYPWGWTVKPPANIKMLKKVAKRFTDTVNHVSSGSTVYQMGSSGPLYGVASGATDDWAYGEIGVPFSYTIELPDQGHYGFLLPENRISSTVTETAAGVYCMVSYLSNTGSCAARRSRNSSLGFRRN